MTAVGEERTAGNEGNLLLQTLHLQVLGIHVLGQNDPGKQAAYGAGIGAAIGQFLSQGIQHHRAAYLIDLTNLADMSVQIEHINPLSGFHLADGGSLQRSCLLHKVVFCQDFIRGADPTQTIAGSQNLGEGAQINDQALGVQALQSGHVFTFETQLAIGVILNDGNFVLVDNLHELMTAIQIPGTAGGVLEIGDDIDHLDLLGGGQNLLQLFHNHAAIIGGNFNELGLASLESVHGAQIGGAFQQHHIAGVQEHAGGEIQTLLAAGGDQNMIRVRVDVILGQHSLSDLLTQTGEPFGAGILQSNAAVLFQNCLGCSDHLLNGKQLGCGHTAGKRNNIGLCS